MKIHPLVGLYGILDPTEEGGEAAERLLSAAARHLAAEGIEVKRSPVVVSNDETALAAATFFTVSDVDLLASVIITWSFDSLHLSILKRVPLPLAVIAVPGIRAGSIVGAQQLGSLLTDLGREHAVFYGPEDAHETYRPVVAYAQAAAVRRRLELAKLGFIGRRTPGMTPIAFDEIEITRKIGPLVEAFDWEDINELANSVPAAEVRDAIESLRERAGTVASADVSIESSMRLAVALRELARRNRILAYGIGCYPREAGRACLALGLLTDEGIPAGCEGDLNSAIGMYLLQCFSGQATHFGEVLEVNEEHNTLITSHCGCGAPSLAARRSDIALAPVRIWHRGVCVRFPAKASPQATFLNLTGRKGTYRLCAVTGSAEESGMVFEGNPVAFRPRIPVRAFMNTVATEGFGHHWMLGYADVVEPLARFCALTGIRGVFLGDQTAGRAGAPDLE